MLRGVHRHWKQVVSYSYSATPINSFELRRQILEVLKECINIGFDVVGTVCDQGSGNRGAINLLKSVDSGVFMVENKSIVPIFDVPHIFKGIRNNLLTKELHYIEEGIPKVAKWDDVIKFYELDICLPSVRLCSKLTDNHIYPNKINKMKVKQYPQVFSNTVGSFLKRIFMWDTKDGNNLDDLLQILNDIFDSFNSKYAPTKDEAVCEAIMTRCYTFFRA